MKPVLGVNGCQETFHDSSATLIAGGEVVATIEEERLNRLKHSRGIPHLAVARVLADAGLEAGDLGAVGFYLDPWLLARHYFLGSVRRFHPAGFGLFQAFPFYLEFLRTGELLRTALGLPGGVPVYKVRHHLCHAAAAYFGSSFERAAVLVIDGSGERETASWYQGEGTRVRPIGSPMSFPDSIGFFYDGIANHVGLGSIEGAGKLMGLAPFGRPAHYEVLRRWFDFRDDGSVRLDLSKMGYYLNQAFFTPSGLADLIAPRRPEDPLTQAHADLAATAQRILEEAVVHMARGLQRRTGLKSLCYAGGVALNIDANSAILEQAGFDEVYIMPAAYDGGTSIGAALAAHFKLNPRAPRPRPLQRADLGTSYDESQARAALDAQGVPWRRLGEAELIDHVARRLAQGAVVGWFRGRMECGPRALGFRSILANPARQAMADYLNATVKGRESFRPFAPAVPLEVADRYFVLLAPSPHMLFKFSVRPEWRGALAAITHVDGSARAQTVTRAENEAFHELLHRFGEISGVPVLLNTSFNLGGEVLVETPEQAVRSFLKGGMDVLVLGNLVADADEAPRFGAFPGLEPMPPGVIALGRSVSPRATGEPRRFGIAPSALESWVRDSIARQGAEGFFGRFHNRPFLALLNAAFTAGNGLDRSVLRSVGD